jgi:hypothetical protein
MLTGGRSRRIAGLVCVAEVWIRRCSAPWFVARHSLAVCTAESWPTSSRGSSGRCDVMYAMNDCARAADGTNREAYDLERRRCDAQEAWRSCRLDPQVGPLLKAEQDERFTASQECWLRPRTNREPVGCLRKSRVFRCLFKY